MENKLIRTIQPVNVTKETDWGRIGMTSLEIELHKKYDELLEEQFRHYTLSEFLNLFPPLNNNYGK